MAWTAASPTDRWQTAVDETPPVHLAGGVAVVKLYTTCATCRELMLVISHPDDTHPCCPERDDYPARLRAEFLAAAEAGDAVRADNLAATLDAVDRAPGDLLAAAQWYALRGWPVLPLVPGGKTPMTRRGFHEATTEQRQIREWWRGHDYNIGIPTGIRFDVIDVDYHRHPEALQAWATISDDYAVHGIAATPRGVHLYVMPTGDTNAAGPGGIAGLDYRGKGGYVVVPPSRRPEGRYVWWSPPSPLL